MKKRKFIPTQVFVASFSSHFGGLCSTNTLKTNRLISKLDLPLNSYKSQFGTFIVKSLNNLTAMPMPIKLLFIFQFLVYATCVLAQPEIIPGLSKKQLKMFFEDGSAIDIKRIKYKGASRGVGLFTDKDSIFNMASGIVLSSGAVKRIARVNKKQNTSTWNWSRGSKYLTKIAKSKTKDASTIQITFIPDSEFISFNFVFGSDEYPEYVKSEFNDVFAFVLVGPNGKKKNLAIIPNTSDKIAVNSVNYLHNQEYYINNSKLQYNLVDDVKIDTTYFWKGYKKYAVYITYNITAAIKDDPKIPVEFDGFTKLLQAKATVEPGKKYQLIISIADAGDRIFDSGVLIEAGSFNASNDENFKYGSLAVDSNYYFTVDTVLVDSIPQKKVIEKTPCIDTTLHLFYATNIYALTDDDRSAISALIADLDSTHQYTVQIDAYNDEVGTGAFNKVLSDNRSKIPLDFIKDEMKTQLFGISAKGHGIDTDTSHNKAFKRRTSIRFICLE